MGTTTTTTTWATTTTTTTTTTTGCTYSCSDSDFTLSGTSTCFYVSTDTATQADAVTACESLGAVLATISDSTEQDDLTSLIGSSDTWIGLNDIDVDETFVWQDGSTASYTNWFGTGNPISPANTNVNCVKMQAAKSGQWNDIGCGKELNYACSMDAVDSCATTTTTTTTTRTTFAATTTFGGSAADTTTAAGTTA